MKHQLLLLALLLAMGACKKNEFVTQTDYNELPEDIVALENYLELPPIFASYKTELPEFLTVMGMVPKAVDNGKATLGRVLFYDKSLSLDNTVSCASCHKQSLAFSDDATVSTGVYGLKGERNALPLANVASFSAHYATGTGVTPLLLWDQRAADVPQQSTLAFINSHEMGMTIPAVIERIMEKPYYPVLWKKVYGSFAPNAEQVLECLEHFVGAIGSDNNRFDKALAAVSGDIDGFVSITTIPAVYYGDTITTLGLPGMSAREVNGRDLFVANCTKCHSPIRALQEVFEACNGLEMDYNDEGKGSLSGNTADNGVFKAPSLRNIQLTAPYMHDGRFKTLEEVVEFYDHGVKPHPNLHPLLLHGGSTKLGLTEAEKSDLVAFLKTLTDLEITKDERFSDPFKIQ